jgi:hypothetical protein
VDDETVTVAGNGSYSTPAGFTPTQAGTYWWTASYGGDPSNNPTSSGCGAESVTIAKASPAIATSPGEGGPVGSTAVTDTASLGGSYNAAGTIEFTLYGPSATANCATASVFNKAVTVNGDGTYTTPSFTPAQAGTYYWTASYGGDTNNNPAATNCGDESVIITPPSHLYWANHFGQGGGTVNEADLDGGNPRAIVTGNEPFGVAVDIRHIYWADMLTGTINEANLDGSNPHAIVSGQNQPAAVAMDSSHIYWTNFGTSTINEANLDGTGVTILLSGQNNAFGLAVDTSHIYWTCDCSSGAINEANLDGGNPHAIVSGLNSPYGVAVDSSRIYWTSIGGTGTINEANLDGSNPHAIVTGQGQPTGVAVDRGHVYWANGVNNTGTISRANLDGTGVTTLATGQQTPRGVAVGPQ